MSNTESLKVLWDRVQEFDRKATYKILAERMEAKFYREFSSNNLGQLIQGTAKSDSPDTKNQIRMVLKEWLASSESAQIGTAESAKPPVAIREDAVEYRTEGEWKSEALKLRDEVVRLRAALHLLTVPQATLSSASIEQAGAFVLGLVKQLRSELQQGDGGSKSKHG